VCWTDQQAKHLRRDKLIKVFEQSQTYIEELKERLVLTHLKSLLELCGQDLL
jgi:hypothetical protein